MGTTFNTDCTARMALPPRAKCFIVFMIVSSIVLFFCFYFQNSASRIIPFNIDRILFPRSTSQNSTRLRGNQSTLRSTKVPGTVSNTSATTPLVKNKKTTTSTTKHPTPSPSRPKLSTASPPAPTVPPKEVKRFLDSARGTTMTKEERQIYIQTLLAFDRLWRQKLGFDYQLYGGALLGAYRHSAFIDYDDDLDIIVSARFINSFASYFAGTNMTIKSQGWKRKVYFNNMDKKTRMTRYGWRWPFLDVFFQKQKKGYLTDPIFSGYTVKVSDVYPNIRIPFEGHLFPVPRCVERVLFKIYGKSCFSTMCTTPWNHKYERGHSKQVCLPYEALKDHFSINEWKRIDDNFMERTVKNPRPGTKPVKQRVFIPKCD